jgi:hypothetical protein
MMIPFTLFQTSATAEPTTVHINPFAVATVTDHEVERVAVIALLHGGRFTVHDPDRTAAQIVAAAQAEESEAQL